MTFKNRPVVLPFGIVVIILSAVCLLIFGVFLQKLYYASSPQKGDASRHVLTRERYTNFDVARVTTDVAPLRAYCYIGDGTSHQLLSVTTCGGMITSGWTLAQWKEYLPSAISLTDEVDWAAIQSFADAQTTDVIMPIYGNAYINRTITTCMHNMYVIGNSLSSSINVISAGVGAFAHCQGDVKAPPNAAFQIFRVRILCLAVHCGDAIDITLNNGEEPSFVMDTVFVEVNDRGSWSNGLKLTGGGGARISNSGVSLGVGESGVYKGICVNLVSALPFTVLIYLTNVHVGNCSNAFRIESVASNTGIEGVYFQAVNADQVGDFFIYHARGAKYNPPEIVFYSVQVSFFHSLFAVDAPSETYVSDWVVRDSWFIQLAPSSASGKVADPPIGLVDFGNAHRVLYEGNNLVQSRGAIMDYYINVPAGAEDWTIENNRTPVMLGSIHKGILHISDGAKIILERDNNWAYSGDVVVNDAWNTNSVLSYAYVQHQGGGLCYAADLAKRGTLTFSKKVCSASVVLMTINNAAELRLPQNVFTSGSAPIIVVGNGWTGSAGVAAVAEGLPTYAKGVWSIPIYFPTMASGAVRIQYTAVGE